MGVVTLGGGVVTLGGVLTVCGRVGGLWSPCVAGGWWGWCWGWCGLGVEAVAAVAVAPAVEEAGVVPGEWVAAEADGGDLVDFGCLVVVRGEGGVEGFVGPGAVFVGAGVAAGGGEVAVAELAAAVAVAVAGVGHDAYRAGGERGGWLTWTSLMTGVRVWSRCRRGWGVRCCRWCWRR